MKRISARSAAVRSIVMRRALLALLIAPALAAADTPAAPTWPAAGVCITPWPSHPASDCIQVNLADARAIQRLMIATATKRGDRTAVAFASRPIGDVNIGPFMPYGYDFADFKGDTLEWVAVESSSQGTETGFKFVVGRATPKAAWQVLWFEHYRKQLPRPN